MLQLIRCFNNVKNILLVKLILLINYIITITIFNNHETQRVGLWGVQTTQ